MVLKNNILNIIFLEKVIFLQIDKALLLYFYFLKSSFLINVILFEKVFPIKNKYFQKKLFIR